MSYVTYDEFETSRSPSAVYWLIGLCVAVYFVQATLVGDDNMALLLGYAPGDLASRSLWTVGTYMFVHGGLLHLLLNMWTLWLFGPRVERAWGASTFTWYYLWCGLGGWAFHYMLQRGGGTLIGASAAILGIAVAYASRWPDDEVLFFGVVPMKGSCPVSMWKHNTPNA
jgi:membrane associated rhomboid family serine protease